MARPTSTSDPIDPPAKAHPLPMPKPAVKPQDAASVADDATPDADAAMPAESPPRIMPLQEMDQQIAEEADRLLQSEQESTAPGAGAPLIADDVPEQAPNAVQEQPEQSAADVVAPMEDPEQQDLRVPGREEDAQPQGQLPVQTDETSEEEGLHLAAQPDETTDALTDSHKPAPEDPPATTPRPQADAHAEPAAGEAAAAHEPAADVASDAVPPDPNEPPKPRRAPKRSSIPAASAKLWQLALWPLVMLLVIINYPMRWLPESARTIFNWFAISLLFWVPAVWFIALVIVGR